MAVRVHAVARPDLPPFDMPDRFRHDVTYFMACSGEPGVPPLGKGEYWIRGENAEKWLDALVIQVVSPLDSRSKAEIELSEEQEAWLEWLVQNQIEHIRLA